MAHIVGVYLVGDVGISSLGEHLTKLGAYLGDRPANGVAIDGGVHAADPVLALGPIDIAALDVEAVEPQQSGLFSADLSYHQNRDTLVRMVLEIPVPKFMLNDQGNWTRLIFLPCALLHMSLTSLGLVYWDFGV
jgi:hypothetical protein